MTTPKLVSDELNLNLPDNNWQLLHKIFQIIKLAKKESRQTPKRKDRFIFFS